MSEPLPAETGRCPRCGKRRPLMWHGRRELCAQCIDRVKHPIETSPANSGEILRGTGRLLRDVGVPCALVAVAFQLPLAALTVWSEAGATIGLFWAPVSLVATGVIIDFALSHVDDRPLRIGPSLGVALRAWVGLLFAAIISELMVAIFTLLLVVPGILRALSYAIVFPLIIDGDARSTDALAVSQARMKGHRGAAFLAYLVVLVPPLLWLSTMGLDSWAMSFDPKATLPPDARAGSAVYGLVDAVLAVPITLVGVVLHLKLRRPTPSKPR